MTTEKLYYNDAYLQEFSARVLSKNELADSRWGVVLTATAFYPEGGGQPCDTGWLDDEPVLAVYEKQGAIVHVVAAPPAREVVSGRIDWTRRYDHMQQHSGEHVLSAAFADELGAENIGFHLGADGVTIDVTLDALTAEQALAVENRANAYVFANRTVTGHLVAGNELTSFPLRKQPAKDFANLRLIAVDGIDCCPCGGTHVAATGEIGLIKIRGSERKGGALRIDFVCGWRALADYRASSAVVRELTAGLSVPATEVPAAFARLQARLDSQGKELQAARQELSGHLAADLYAAGETVGETRLVVKTLADAAPAELAELARRILACGPAIALLGTASAEAGKLHLLFAASPGTTANMNDLLKKVLPLVNGRGGGNSLQAQGGGAFSDKLEDALQVARQDVLAG